MTPEHFAKLARLGLNPAMARDLIALNPAADTHWPYCRVVEVHRETAVLHDGERSFSARPLPALLQRLTVAQRSLAVGDWVATAIPEGDRTPWIAAQVPPHNSITRRDGDGVRHTVVANIDCLLIVMGLDHDFNLRRLERYLAIAHTSQITPVVVLTKADAPVRPVDDALDAIRTRVPGHVEVMAVDGRDASVCARLAPWLGLSQTAVLMGSSGAGKSTLTNTLTGSSTQDTGANRADDSRGRHTTTARSLHLTSVALGLGGCIIDTPGLRALAPDADAEDVAASFEDVAQLALHCRFRDCEHKDEPGCAVRAALPADRLLNYHKLLREAARETRTPLQRQAERAKWTAISKSTRAYMKMKGRA